jgi:hypothetical protein
MRFLVLLAIFGLSGCATTSYCVDEQKYQEAKSVPPIKGTEAVRLPESHSALRIPPPPEKPVAFGEIYKDEDGDERVRCLETPPQITLPPPAPAAPTPAPVPAPEEKPKS